ncbi:MAG: 3-hydroxyacyl-CoA dehydrogenase family protein [Flavobacteriales bacterium]
MRYRDTPAFIANRVGVFGIMGLFHLVEEMGLTVEEMDRLTGPVLGEPKSATFRTADVVGLDTLIEVAKGVQENCPDDERNALFAIPDYLRKMEGERLAGQQERSGFLQEGQGEGREGEILAAGPEDAGASRRPSRSSTRWARRRTWTCPRPHGRALRRHRQGRSSSTARASARCAPT